MKKNLRQHLEILGMQPNMLDFHSKVGKAVIDRALAGKPIATSHAEAIVGALNKAHGWHMNKKNHLRVEDIEGMQTLSLDDLKGESSDVV